MSKWKRRKMVTLARGIVAVSELKGINFCYGVNKNHDELMAELEPAQSGLKPTRKIKEYNDKRMEICKEFAKTDNRGRPLTRSADGTDSGPPEYIVPPTPEFDEKIDELNAEYKDELDKREKLEDDYETSLDGEVEFKPLMIHLRDVPKDITVGQMGGIFSIIKGDPSELKEEKKGRKDE